MNKEKFNEKAISFLEENLIREIYATDKYGIYNVIDGFLCIFHYEFYDKDGNPIGIILDSKYIKKFIVDKVYQYNVLKNTLHNRTNNYKYFILKEEKKEKLRDFKKTKDPEIADLIEKTEKAIQQDVDNMKYPKTEEDPNWWEVDNYEIIESDLKMKDIDLQLKKEKKIIQIPILIILLAVLEGIGGKLEWSHLLLIGITLALVLVPNKLNTKYFSKKFHVLFYDYKNEKYEKFYTLDKESGKPYEVLHYFGDPKDSESVEQYSVVEIGYQELATCAWVHTINGYEKLKDMNENNWREYLEWQV